MTPVPFDNELLSRNEESIAIDAFCWRTDIAPPLNTNPYITMMQGLIVLGLRLGREQDFYSADVNEIFAVGN